MPELVLANINSVLDKNLLELLHYGRHSPKFPVTKYEVQIIEYILPIFLGVELPDMSVYISFCKVVLEGYILRHFLMALITWNAEGIPRLKTGLVSNFIFFCW